MIIGFMGEAGSGKSTLAKKLAELLTEQGYEIQQISFAKPVKDMLGLLGLTYEELYGSQKNVPNLPVLGGATPRQAMQTLGTEWGRALYNDIWVSKAIREAHRFEELNNTRKASTIIDDVRFLNEALAIVNNGGVIINVLEQISNFCSTLELATGLSGREKLHLSETERELVLAHLRTHYPQAISDMRNNKVVTEVTLEDYGRVKVEGLNAK